MPHSIEPHALLLQVVAHDLLAPLTAVKWQTELLARLTLDDVKRVEYLQNISRSVELGIALSKHAHVAARVLADGYEGAREMGRLHDAIRKAANALKEQYIRHGIALSLDVRDEGQDRLIDSELVGFCVWLAGKYFLTRATAGHTVEMHGEPVSRDGNTQYALTVYSTNIEGATHYASVFDDEETQDALDQTFVFAYLLRRTASLVPYTISAHAEQKKLAIRMLL